MAIQDPETKTFNTLIFSIDAKLVKDSFVLFTRCRIHMDKKAKAGEPEYEHTVMFSDEEILEINKNLGVVEGTPLGWRPSAGFWAESANKK